MTLLRDGRTGSERKGKAVWFVRTKGALHTHLTTHYQLRAIGAPWVKAPSLWEVDMVMC